MPMTLPALRRPDMRGYAVEVEADAKGDPLPKSVREAAPWTQANVDAMLGETPQPASLPAVLLHLKPDQIGLGLVACH